jgi:ABC-type glycerol-3-phosphate transport system substrate-binding protein
LPVGTTGDSTFWVAALFRSFGAALVDAKGTITAKSDDVRQVLDYARRLTPFLPPDVYSWDDASNNRALISGKSALIINPASAWVVAMRDNPKVGEQIWHHPYRLARTAGSYPAVKVSGASGNSAGTNRRRRS